MNSLLQWAKFIDQWPWSINTKEGLESLIIRQFLWFWCSPQIQNFHWPWGKNSTVLSNRGLSKTQQNKESECSNANYIIQGFLEGRRLSKEPPAPTPILTTAEYHRTRKKGGFAPTLLELMIHDWISACNRIVWPAYVARNPLRGLS